MVLISQHFAKADIISMDKFTGEYQRPYDCWDCFDAGGRMCHGKNYAVIFNYTFSSNYNKGICCKPGSTDSYCDGSIFDCSMDSIGGSTDNKYKNVLTTGKNYQMFAYCPGLPEHSCGMPKGQPAPNLFAKNVTQTVSSTELRHRHGN